jgi:5'-deoxynucleotidase YfbR-like HD superfamily hydrolase
LLGLLQDAGEASLGDLPRPVKAEFDEFERAETRILQAIRAAFDVEPPDDDDDEWAAVMAADDRL